MSQVKIVLSLSEGNDIEIYKRGEEGGVECG